MYDRGSGKLPSVNVTAVMAEAVIICDVDILL